MDSVSLKIQCRKAYIEIYLLVGACVGFECVMFKGFAAHTIYSKIFNNYFFMFANQMLLVVYMFGFLLFINIIILSGVLAFSMLMTWKLRLKHLKSILKSKKLKNYFGLQKLFTRYLVNCLQSKRMYANFFLFYLLISYPTNCCVIHFMYKIDDLFVRFALSIVMVEQIISIVLLHIVIANLNTELFVTSKQAMRQFTQNNHRFNVRSKLKYSLFIQAIFTKNRYGMTYGKFGQITALTFFKVCFYL